MRRATPSRRAARTMRPRLQGSFLDHRSSRGNDLECGGHAAALPARERAAAWPPHSRGNQMINRRMFLKAAGLALVAGGLLPNVFVKMANAATTKGRKVLVAIFQRGAVDGLNVVVPYGEKAYYDARPTIAIPRPGSGDNAALDLDGFFG